MHLRLLCCAAVLAGTGLLHAQDPVIAPDLSPPPAAGVIGESWTDAELENLVGPIALHPDALIALILPAATNPSDVVLAARRLAVNADPTRLDEEPWDDSVRGLARYPEIIRWMDDNLAWTKEMGLAFAAQPADVMNAIQRLRTKARAVGTLRDTPQQQVVVVEEEIRIVPAQTEVIYVPRYDPAVVYVSRPVYYPSAFLTFGFGYPVGHWLAYDCDWRHRTVWVVPPRHRPRVWHERRDWRHHDHGHRLHDDRWHAWRPRPIHPRPGGGDYRHRYRPGYDRGMVNRPSPTHPPRNHDGQRGDWQRGDRERGDRHRVDGQHDRSRILDRDETTVARTQRPRPWDGRRPPESGDRVGDRTERRWDRSHGENSTLPAQRWNQPRSGEGRRDTRTVGADLPGGPTPTMAAPVAPVGPVAPVAEVRATTQPRPSAPVLSPNGRRLPGNEPPREFVRSPNGRHMVAPSTPPPAHVVPPPASTAQYSAPRESPRPQIHRTEVARSEAPRRMESVSRAEHAPRQGRSEHAASRPDNGRSQAQRDVD